MNGDLRIVKITFDNQGDEPHDYFFKTVSPSFGYSKQLPGEL